MDSHILRHATTIAKHRKYGDDAAQPAAHTPRTTLEGGENQKQGKNGAALGRITSAITLFHIHHGQELASEAKRCPYQKHNQTHPTQMKAQPDKATERHLEHLGSIDEWGLQPQKKKRSGYTIADRVKAFDL